MTEMTEIKRDKLGRIIPGQRSLNPSGRRQVKELNKLIDQAFPEEFIVSYFYSKVMNLNTDKSNKKDILAAIKDKDFKKVFKKFLKDLPDDNTNDNFYAGLTEMDRINLLKDIWDRRYGKPLKKQDIQMDSKQYNIKVDLPEELKIDDL